MMRWKQSLAAALAVLSLGTALAGCSSKEENSVQSSETTTAQAATEAVTEATEAATEEETAAEETTEAPTEAPTEHVSPVETVRATLGAEVSEINAVLDRDGTNTYKADLSDMITEGDTVHSFTFIVYSGDGASNMVNYKGGCGISVTEDCPAATDEGWYQSDDFEYAVNGAYAEITWNVPADVAPYVDANGEVLIGYWWSEVQQVRLSSVICNYTRTAEVPVDGQTSVSPAAVLSYGSEETKTAHVDLSELISEGDTVQTVTFDISAGGSLGKFTGAFGVSLEEGSKAATDENWYQTGNIAVITDASDLSLTWIVPEDVKADISAAGEVMLGFWWSDQSSITLDRVTVRYSNSTGETAHKNEVQDNEELVSGNGSTASAEEVNNMTSAEIVADISVGWNLGNTLDSYDTSESDTEIGWGNPKTTQAMIDAVQDAGFNAIRIPVTWGEHMSADGTIEAAWMARVKEVVDYAMNNGMYVILNVHHDDYIWLTPTYSEQAAVEAKLMHIWEQICAAFKDYDHHLIFEGMNEPRVVGSATEWSGGTPEEHDVINQLFAKFVETVRATGGLNADRTLIVTSHAQSITETAVNAVKVPDDDHVIVSIHSYAPWDFCGPDSTRSDWGSDADQAELDKNFQFLADTFISKGIPVIIDEFGAINKNGNTADRAAYFEYYIRSAKQHGIKCFVWDNGEAEEEFTLLDRETCTWEYPSIVNAIMRGAE
ncbi:MAG: cellulase family glycosylhydrolase [Ruminococcus sp.]|nr:cellulase family glycosylhydrolase [Ruminococcus sp.]